MKLSCVGAFSKASALVYRSAMARAILPSQSTASEVRRSIPNQFAVHRSFHIHQPLQKELFEDPVPSPEALQNQSSSPMGNRAATTATTGSSAVDTSNIPALSNSASVVSAAEIKDPANIPFRPSVQRAKPDYYYYETPEQKKQRLLKYFFSTYDTNHDGKIDLAEFRNMVKQYSSEPLSEEKLQKMFNAADTDRSGGIDYQEFLALTAGLNTNHLTNLPSEDEINKVILTHWSSQINEIKDPFLIFTNVWRKLEEKYGTRSCICYYY
eukprot:GEZU01012243.1.p1 GENE.GEZU01012243.1~~GEZU01012243.1.p1  ORF type:complete len:280 (-),score=35.09 GEZU01012243.1:17-820(-)